MAALFVAVLVLIAIEIVAVRYGVDSRDSDDWVRHRHTHPTR